MDTRTFPKHTEVSWQIETPSGLLLVAVGGSSKTLSSQTESDPAECRLAANAGTIDLPTSEWEEVHGQGQLRVIKNLVGLTKSSQGESRTQELERTAKAVNLGSGS